MKMTVFWDTVLSSLTEGDQCFRVAYHFHNQGVPIRLHGAISQKAVISRVSHVSHMEKSAPDMAEIKFKKKSTGV
jgi:hypothetical protein